MTALKNNNSKNASKILIFDTNIFLTGIDLNIIKDLIYTTPSVIDEIRIRQVKGIAPNAICFGYAVAGYGNILETFNGGLDWIKLESNSTKYFL